MMHTLTIKIQSQDKEFIKELLKTFSSLNGKTAVDNFKIETRVESGNNFVKEKVIELIKKGIPSEEIAKQTGLTKYQVAAYRAHISMGRY